MKTRTSKNGVAGLMSRLVLNIKSAALAAARRCDPREVPLADIKASLSKIGHIVPVPDP